MPFKIPNVAGLTHAGQARVTETDFDIIAAGIHDYGINTGCQVTTTGAANGSVTVATGIALVNGVYVNIVAGNVALNANASGNDRIDLITVDDIGTEAAVVGTPGAVPLLPDIPSDRTVLAAVYVPNGFTTGTTVTADQIVDKRVFQRTGDFQGHNVLDYGAVGDSSHATFGAGTDDTAAIQAAYTAAQEAGGFGVVVFPGNRTYRITDTIECQTDLTKQSVWTWGVGSMGFNRVVNMPNIAWGGAAGGTMFNSEASGPNLQAALFRNVRFAGLNVANTAIRFGPSGTNFAKIDTGTGLDEVHMGAFAGNGIQIDSVGATNFWIRGGRWDRIAGYAIYMKVASQTFVSIRDVTWDAWDAILVDAAKGFVHFDAGVHAIEGANNTHYVMAHFDGVHFESGGLSDQVPTASETAGRRGIIKCTIDNTEVIVQHKIAMTNCQVLGWNSGDDSHCLIQMDGGASDAERKARLNFNGRNLFGFNGDGSAATGHVIPFGNMGLTNPDPGDEYQELTHRFSGGGVTASRYPRVWNNTA
jgi:hypothetical protein